MPDVAKMIQIETDMTFLFKNITIPLQHQKINKFSINYFVVYKVKL